MAELANATLSISDDDWSSDDRIRKRQLISFIIKILILGVIIVVGIIGNCLTFVVFWKGNFKSSTSFLFLSLSLADSAYLMAVLPRGIRPFVDYTDCWFRGLFTVEAYWTVYGTFLVATTKTATIWVTVLVAFNRYIIVCRPLRASQWCTISKVKIQLAVVLVIAVVCSIPFLFNYRISYYAVNNGTSYIIGVAYRMGYKWRPFYNVYSPVLTMGLWMGVPLCILTLLTIRLIKAMKAHRRMQQEMNSQHNQQENSMTFALVMVVVVLIVCHVPSFVSWMVWILVSSEVLLVNEVWYIVEEISDVLVIFNSAINFLIYTLANKRFRDVLTKTICRRHGPIERRVVTARQMARAEAIRDEPDDVNDTALNRHTIMTCHTPSTTTGSIINY